MSYLVLARKYRPKNFSEMVGQSHVVQALGNALRTQRLHHAYLFTGTRGVGKTTISRILAKSLNCIGPDGQGGITATPCNVCQACLDIDTGRFVDYTELDAASNRGIDDMQTLLEQAVYKPVQGRFKVFMIDEVHMLTGPAFNTMLKTLEEPPEYLKFVLATTDPQKVPATVLSRCLQFNLRPMAPETILQHLGHVLTVENVPSEVQALRLLARAARGSMRDALSLTDQAIAFGAGELLEASVRLMLGSVDRSYVFCLLDALARGDGKTVVETSEALRLNGLSAASTLDEMATVLQRMAVLQAVPAMMAKAANAVAECVTNVSASDDDADPEATETVRLAQTMAADETQLLYSLCLYGRAELGLAPDEYAALTMVLLRLLAFKPAGSEVVAAAMPTLSMPASWPGSAAEPAKKPQPEPLLQKPPVKIAVKTATVDADLAVAATKAVENNPFEHAIRPLDQSIRGQQATYSIASANAAPQDSPISVASISPTSLGNTWSDLVGKLVAAEAIGAMVRELALQSELVSQDGSSWTLRVERPSLNQSAAREKLQLALQTLTSSQPAIRLMVEVGPIGDSPARRNLEAHQQRQREAEDIIHNDPFVQSMLRDWGAKIGPISVTLPT